MSRRLIFFDGNNDIILESELVELDLNEDYILREAIKRFNNPEPCIIHRTHIIKKFHIEFYNFIEEAKKEVIKNEFIWSNTPMYIREAINLNKTPYKFTVNE